MEGHLFYGEYSNWQALQYLFALTAKYELTLEQFILSKPWNPRKS